jgi:glycosyltransferase involved in cell wall biosynthesis
MAPPVRILHAHSTFALGGKEARAVQLMNAFGGAAEHTVLSASPGQFAARAGLDAALCVDFPGDGPSLTGLPTPARLLALARSMRPFDLVLTYNWGACDMVMARRLFGGALRLPPLVHHEDGFNGDEAARLDPKRNLYRRLGLGAAYRLVVPSQVLAAIARKEWRQPPQRIERIPNGIPVARYALPPSLDALGLGERGEIVIGTVAGLRPVKNLARMVRAFAAVKSAKVRLIIVGEGPESERIAAEARACGVSARVDLPGFRAEPWRWIGGFDIFALSSDSEQFPISLVEAMAAGLPAVATSVGDIPNMVSPENRRFIVAPEDEAGFAASLETLAERPDLRLAVGAANRAKAAANMTRARWSRVTRGSTVRRWGGLRR